MIGRSNAGGGGKPDKGTITPAADTLTLTIPTNLQSVSRVIIRAKDLIIPSSGRDSYVEFVIAQSDILYNETVNSSNSNVRAIVKYYSSYGGTKVSANQIFSMSGGNITIGTANSSSYYKANTTYEYELYE